MKANWIIRARFIDPGLGWQLRETPLENVTLETAYAQSSRIATALDRDFGESHFWTVDVYSADSPEHGSYAQLFHGRLS